MDKDLRFRLAVFDHVSRLRDLHAGLIPDGELNLGVKFEGATIPIWNQAKGIFRPAFLREPGAALTIVTSVKSPYDDRIDAADGRIWYRYRGADPMQSDNVAVRRAMELRRPLLYLMGIEPRLHDASFPVYVVSDDPASLMFGLSVDLREAVTDPIVLGDRVELRREYATRAVQQRLHQYRFRAAVLGAYGRACTVCRLRHTPLLEAAHILPDRHPLGKPEVPNGLSLCKIHHSALDASILGIDPEYVVHIRADVLEEINGPMLKHGLQELHEKRIHLPRRLADRPNQDFLAERFHRFRAA